MTTTTDLNAMMAKVTGLLAHAEDSANPPELQAQFRARAQAIMKKYRFDQEQLIAEDPTAVSPEWALIQFPWHGKWGQSYYNLFHTVAAHAGVEHHAVTQWDAKLMQRVARIEAVGYAGDLRLAEFIFSQVRIAFQEALEPEVRADLTDGQNVYRLRTAGTGRDRIGTLMGWGDKAGQRVTREYVAECERRGEDPKVVGKSFNARNYADAYASSFVSRFRQRLREARDAADSAGGGALVLHGRKERVQEALWERFPDLRPSQEVVEVKECERCKIRKAKGQGPCRGHKASTWTKADEARWQRLNYGSAAEAGRHAGRTAAESVELDTAPRARRLGDGGRGDVESVVREDRIMGQLSG